jgi:hypothetical protein
MSESEKNSSSSLVSVLIDNSTYFSFKNLLGSKHIDGDSLFNAANFAECLLLSDEVLTSPTVIWEPDDSDPLYGTGKPCRQISPEQLTNDQLNRLFSRAIDAALTDINDNLEIIQYRTEALAIRDARLLLGSWKNIAKEDPRGFLTTFSMAAYHTDEASKVTLSKLNSSSSESDDASRHLAHYLLRTNAAVELAQLDRSKQIPYHPHSYRMSYVLEKAILSKVRAKSAVTALIREAEKQKGEFAKGLRDETLMGELGGFNLLGSDAPLVLSVALSGSQSPEDVINKLIELRETKEARRYRKWVRHLTDAVYNADFKARVDASNELEIARTILAKELSKLYGMKSHNVSKVASGIVDTVDFEAVATHDLSGVGIPIAKKLIAGARGAMDWLKEKKVNRKIALVVGLIRSSDPEAALGPLIERVFGSTLSDQTVQRFAKLRQQQSNTLSRLKNI